MNYWYFSNLCTVFSFSLFHSFEELCGRNVTHSSPYRFSGLLITKPSLPPAALTGGSTSGISVRSERSSRQKMLRTVLRSCWWVKMVKWRRSSALITSQSEFQVLLLCFSLVHPWWTHSKDLGLFLEPQRAVGHLFGVGGQHHASVANGEFHQGRATSWKY